MLKAYKYKLKPTLEQEQGLLQTFGNCRYVYNRALNLKKTMYESDKTNLSGYDLMKILTQKKKQEGYEWLNLSSSIVLQSAISNMDTAYKNFFRTKKGFPKFKSKHSSKDSFQIKQGTKIDYFWNGVFIPKIGWVKFFKDRKIVGEIRNATVSKQASGYYISIVCEDGLEKKYMGGVGSVGIDLGLKDFLITSDGNKIKNPKFLSKSQKILRKHQRKLARQKKSSERMKKQKQIIARLHENISNQRKDFLHKLSTVIAKQYDTVCVEDLNVKGMMQNRCLSKAVGDVGRGMFGTMLKSKCNKVIVIGRFELSSKLCNQCLRKNTELKLKDRTRKCGGCGVEHDRDVNASLNILRLGTQVTDVKVNH